MLIDFHSHIFPDSIAPRAIASLKQGMIDKMGFTLPSYLEGTLSCLLETMEKERVDLSVIMPIATTPKQSASINRFAASARSDKIVAFGTVHPMQENWEETLENVKTAGFPGIKLHPEFQGCYFDSPETIRVLKKAASLNLMVLTHAGNDVGILPPVHSTPERIRRALDASPNTILIAAHMGGYDMWDDAVKFLSDTNAFVDTAYVETAMKPRDFRDLARAFGTDRVLFGSDSPWAYPRSHTLSFIEKSGLTDDEIALITHKNAMKLLGI